MATLVKACYLRLGSVKIKKQNNSFLMKNNKHATQNLCILNKWCEKTATQRLSVKNLIKNYGDHVLCFFLNNTKQEIQSFLHEE